MWFRHLQFTITSLFCLFIIFMKDLFHLCPVVKYFNVYMSVQWQKHVIKLQLFAHRIVVDEQKNE